LLGLEDGKKEHESSRAARQAFRMNAAASQTRTPNRTSPPLSRNICKAVWEGEFERVVLTR
jgi:hypothetical protein